MGAGVRFRVYNSAFLGLDYEPLETLNPMVWSRDVNGAAGQGMRGRCFPALPPNLFSIPIPVPRHGGTFFPIPIPTDPHVNRNVELGFSPM
ncbi:hypothetical protein A2U01_0002836 [Trifolium medium]|uniref:Uncharacterized protein n=1 Tax=Trifolium medium TaxID=97028 RepID=A0A392M3W0_9FABA|nr:hypothetical protein [Trifolium medium]